MIRERLHNLKRPSLSYPHIPFSLASTKPHAIRILHSLHLAADIILTCNFAAASSASPGYAPGYRKLLAAHEGSADGQETLALNFDPEMTITAEGFAAPEVM
jgi:hypothetical protein